jgi:hypothetical protein
MRPTVLAGTTIARWGLKKRKQQGKEKFKSSFQSQLRNIWKKSCKLHQNRV